MSGAASKKHVVLVVDDQTNVRNILEFNLKRRGFEILAAPDGLAALSLATNHVPQLILLDIMMPGIDGYQVLEKLRSTPKTAQIPVLIVSAKGTEDDILRALKLGARDYIVKPFNLELLMQKVFKLIESTAGAAAEAPKGSEAPAAGRAATWPWTAVVGVGANYPVDDDPLTAELVRIAESGARTILLDLTSTGPVQALSFGKLAKAQQSVKKAGGQVKILTTSDEHRKTLAESGFLKHFELHPGWDAAMAEFAP